MTTWDWVCAANGIGDFELLSTHPSEDWLEERCALVRHAETDKYYEVRYLELQNGPEFVHVRRVIGRPVKLDAWQWLGAASL